MRGHPRRHPRGNGSLNGAGGGEFCDLENFENSTLSTIEGSSVAGHVTVEHLRSCRLGFARNDIGGNLNLHENSLADPDRWRSSPTTSTGT